MYHTFCDISLKHAYRKMVHMATYTKSENSNLIKTFMLFCYTLKVSNLGVNSSVMKRSSAGFLEILRLLRLLDHWATQDTKGRATRVAQWMVQRCPNGWKSGNIYISIILYIILYINTEFGSLFRGACAIWQGFDPCNMFPHGRFRQSA